MHPHFSSLATRSWALPLLKASPLRLTTREYRMNKGSEDPSIIQLSFPAALAQYLQRVSELGAVEGLQGSVQINPTLAPVLEAMHHVLAGGEVEVRILRGGQQEIVQELQQRAVQVTQETNAIQQPPGGVVVTAV